MRRERLRSTSVTLGTNSGSRVTLTRWMSCKELVEVGQSPAGGSRRSGPGRASRVLLCQLGEIATPRETTPLGDPIDSPQQRVVERDEDLGHLCRISGISKMSTRWWCHGAAKSRQELERVDVAWPHDTEMPTVERGELALVEPLDQREHCCVDEADS